MPEIPILLIIVFSVGGGTIFVWAFVNVGMWLCDRSEEKRRRAESREQFREYERRREIMRMQRSGIIGMEVDGEWLQRPPEGDRRPPVNPDNDGKPSGEDWVRYCEHLLQAAAAASEEIKKIEAVKKVADESIIRVIDLK